MTTEGVVSAALLALCVLACDSDTSFVPSPLVPPFYSGMSVAEFRSQPQLAKLEVTVEPAQQHSVGEGEAVELVVVTVEGFKSLGSKGRLRLWFFDDQLVWSEYYPEDFEASLAGLASQLNRRTFPADGSVHHGNTRIWARRAVERGPMIGWRDERLSERFMPYDTN